MSNYVPKVGDKVRATLGESVFEGKVVPTPYPQPREIPSQSAWVELDPALGPIQFMFRDGWQFEQIITVPTKFGAVIRRADGVTLTLQDPIHEGHLRWLAANTWQWSGDAQATSGGFTVLFEGVDE